MFRTLIHHHITHCFNLVVWWTARFTECILYLQILHSHFSACHIVRWFFGVHRHRYIYPRSLIVIVCCIQLCLYISIPNFQICRPLTSSSSMLGHSYMSHYLDAYYNWIQLLSPDILQSNHTSQTRSNVLGHAIDRLHSHTGFSVKVWSA